MPYRRDFNKGTKKNEVYTPAILCDFLYDILSPLIQPKTILDPAIGTGNLVRPWKSNIIGVDVDPIGDDFCDDFYLGRFEDKFNYPKPDLILCNPPFCGGQGKMLYSEVFMRHFIKLFGSEVPTVLITPMGFRLNNRINGRRWTWLRNECMPIKSIISLPLNLFPDVLLHCEVLIYNVDGLEPHYIIPC